MDSDKLHRIEAEIAEEVGVSKDCIMIDVPEYPSFHEMSTLVTLNGDEIKKLGEISSIVSALNQARFNHADVCIYLPEEYSSKAVDFPFKNYIPF